MSERLPAGSDDARIIGSNAWAAAGGAPLDLGRRLRLFLETNLVYLGEAPGELRWALSSRGLFPAAPVPRVGVQPLPDTRAVEMAINQLERYAEGEREVLRHSYRTFHFADLLHRRAAAALPMDREVLAVATLLHDVGMYPRAVAEFAGNDFTVRGARLARRIGQQAGWSQHRIDLAAQAITINANAIVSRHWGAEAHFARIAPIVDVAGQVWKIHPDDARQIFAQHPAQDLAASILRCADEEARRSPGSRFAVYNPLFPFITMHCKCRWHQRLNQRG